MSKEIKDLLEKDYSYRSEALGKSEQSGETRLNLFIGFVTLAVGLMGSVFAKDSGLEGTLRLLVLLGGLTAVLGVGVATFLRMITRNIRTDEAKIQLDVIRQTFKDHFDDEGALIHYKLFPAPRGGTREQGRELNARRFGGLAHTVAIINALLCAGIIGVIILLIAERSSDRIPAFIIAGGSAFGLALYSQVRYANREEKRAGKTFRSGLGLPTHAGGVVYEVRSGKPYYLLVSPKDGRSEWVLPQGHIEQGEDHRETALREVREEAGVVARLVGSLGRIKFKKLEKDQDAKFYLMEKMYQVEADDKQRRAQWLPFEQAVAELTYEDSRHLLREAAKRVRQAGIPTPDSGDAPSRT
jgi:8-oxo-dGTP pyrophosphatase MutT (NUDIX family)